ncbi:hypothetical protein [Williamsia sp. 1135]|uniref:hypothetical protein n=1 Tax=Williamsia sp. 1135 TaxID=1889262 RepID=UPI001F0ADE64|nr:hypothetical protein [Williamsia sp. 1135]
MRRRPKFLSGTAIAVFTVLTVVLASCSTSETAEVGADGKVTVRYQGWASQVGWSELAESLGYFQKVKLEWVGDTTSGPQDIQAVATGEIDTGSAFNGGGQVAAGRVEGDRGRLHQRFGHRNVPRVLLPRGQWDRDRAGPGR